MNKMTTIYTNQKYYTARIRISNMGGVLLEVQGTDGQFSNQSTGVFGYNKVKVRVEELHEKARSNELNGAEVEELGELLFSALFDDGLRRDFLDIYQTAKAQNALLRLELDIDEEHLPEIAALPWEFMYMPGSQRSDSMFLATDPGMTLIRRRALWHIPEPIHFQHGENLRIAVAVAAPKDQGAFQYQALINELKKMAERGMFEVQVAENATRRSIDDLLLEQKPHIFHFIGHGRLTDENNVDIGQLALDDGAGKTDIIEAKYFSDLVRRSRPGLVILQSCESGALSSSRAYVGIASRIIQMNVPAVIAMQYPVFNPVAQAFVREFYCRLTKNESVDKAMQEARRSLILTPKGYNGRHFATPVLFMNVIGGRLFDSESPVNPVHIQNSDMGENKEIKYDILARRLERGEIVPFLGSETMRLSDIQVPELRDIIDSMANDIHYPKFNGTLPMISQYYHMKDYSRGMIIDKVGEIAKMSEEPLTNKPLYDLLASIQKPILVICASYDNILEFTYRRKNKKYAVISHFVGPDFGNLIVKRSDRDTELYTSEKISGLKLLEEGYSVIYKICGCFDSSMDNPVLILENDFFTFSRHFEQSIPDYITRHSRRRGFMFLGYNLEQWHDRLIAHAFLEKNAGQSDSSISVWSRPSLYDSAFWKFNHVEVYNIELNHFVEKLMEHQNGGANGKGY
ncbi:MAG: CHAT domain-containing protein [Candidatus Omnitrophota bacterium]